ncbi:hypothetical protein DFP72DRAFT_943025 [Ephemerocybe angulata]|uniref:Uncharacterized protein n=1 Tax=Ephemerocybe angulata TaxID=980116 RepID=A0A8H6LTF3_9AGAR|nr:hypothetical protein DFP72DRAFT_943017 [Tulosesus angulatus]KAF6741589.1 hypothetical protein DFP72DRAFT_943025 [Tulosesus angulatus]
MAAKASAYAMRHAETTLDEGSTSIRPTRHTTDLRPLTRQIVDDDHDERTQLKQLQYKSYDGRLRGEGARSCTVVRTAGQWGRRAPRDGYRVPLTTTTPQTSREKRGDCCVNRLGGRAKRRWAQGSWSMDTGQGYLRAGEPIQGWRRSEIVTQNTSGPPPDVAAQHTSILTQKAVPTDARPFRRHVQHLGPGRLAMAWGQGRSPAAAMSCPPRPTQSIP